MFRDSPSTTCCLSLRDTNNTVPPSGLSNCPLHVSAMQKSTLEKVDLGTSLFSNRIQIEPTTCFCFSHNENYSHQIAIPNSAFPANLSNNNRVGDFFYF